MKKDRCCWICGVAACTRTRSSGEDPQRILFFQNNVNASTNSNLNVTQRYPSELVSREESSEKWASRLGSHVVECQYLSQTERETTPTTAGYHMVLGLGGEERIPVCPLCARLDWPGVERMNATMTVMMSRSVSGYRIMAENSMQMRQTRCKEWRRSYE